MREGKAPSSPVHHQYTSITNGLGRACFWKDNGQPPGGDVGGCGQGALAPGAQAAERCVGACMRVSGHAGVCLQQTRGGGTAGAFPSTDWGQQGECEGGHAQTLTSNACVYCSSQETMALGCPPPAPPSDTRRHAWVHTMAFAWLPRGCAPACASHLSRPRPLPHPRAPRPRAAMEHPPPLTSPLPHHASPCRVRAAQQRAAAGPAAGSSRLPIPARHALSRQQR